MKKTSTYMRTVTAMVVASTIFSSCANMYIKNGQKAFGDLRYQDAIWYFEKGLAKKDNPEARKNLASAYLKTNNFEKANEQFNQTALYTDNTDADRIMQGEALMSNGKYEEAKTIFEGILSRDPNNKLASSLLQSCKKENELKSDSSLFIVNAVNIPTDAPVYSATPYNDGFIVSSPAGKSNDNDPYTNKAWTDLYFTKTQGVDAWTALTPIENVNSPYHDAVAVVSPNGQTMIFTRSLQLKQGTLSGNDKEESNTQLYMSKVGVDGKWGKPELLPFCDVKYMFAHPALSPDGQTLYFASDMPGGFGAMDLYSSQLTDGSWGSPSNLGGDINSSGNELFPTLKDANTLYYSSNGLKSLGGLDIMTSVKNGSKWALPQHVTYPINTDRDDFSLIWNSDGKTGYFTSDRTGIDKIYSFEEIKAVITLTGLVNGKDSMLPLGGARVTIQNLTDGTEQIVFTDGNGNFSTELKSGKDYKIKTDLDGYFTEAGDISTKGITSSKELKKVVEMSEAYVAPKDNTADNKGGSDNKGGGDNKGSKGSKTGGGKYPVPNIYWDYNKWDIRQDSYAYLDDVVKLFRNNQNLKFEIRSHTDCRGSFEYNDDLSSKRAKEVLDYLVKKGVPRSIITSKGFGERELVNECSDGVPCEENLHQENRRTEFVVTDKK